MFSKVALASLVLGALYANGLAVQVARSPAPESESQDVEARFGPLLGVGLAGLSGLATGAFFKKPKREAEPDTQELEARLNALVFPEVAGAGTFVPPVPGFPNPKRDTSDDLFSREPEGWNKWAEAVRDQASKREPFRFPLFRRPSTPRPPPRITVTPPTPTAPAHKREISDDLTSREPEDWAQLAEAVRDQASKREPFRFPIIRRPSTPRPPPRITVTPPTPTRS